MKKKIISSINWNATIKIEISEIDVINPILKFIVCTTPFYYVSYSRVLFLSVTISYFHTNTTQQQQQQWNQLSRFDKFIQMAPTPIIRICDAKWNLQKFCKFFDFLLSFQLAACIIDKNKWYLHDCTQRVNESRATKAKTPTGAVCVIMWQLNAINRNSYIQFAASRFSMWARSHECRICRFFFLLIPSFRCFKCQMLCFGM